MRARLFALTGAASALALAVAAQPAAAEEGMWTFDQAPLARINRELGVDLDQAWLDRVRMGSVKIQGCSGSLLSDAGLIMTNQHCVRSCVQANAQPGQDLLAQGVLAQAREEELRCPGQTAEVLLEITDVTDRIRAAGEGLEGGAYTAARSAAQTAIEQEACQDRAGERCQVVSLYRGGQYKLYRYRRYDDVRLVYVPEHQAVVFGGYPDNFNFPRFGIDSAFLRAYENGRPAHTPDHLRWNPRTPVAGEPTFVSGNPGSTSRLKTTAQLETERDWQLTPQIDRLADLRGRVVRFSEESDENRRVTRDIQRGIENNQKRANGMHRALSAPGFLDAREQAEAEFLVRARAAGAIPADQNPFAALEGVQAAQVALTDRHDWLESQAGGGSVLFGWARNLVRAAAEREKPSNQRLSEYSDSRLPLLERSLLDPRNLSADLETLYLSFWLSKSREILGADHPAVERLLGQDSPEALAARLVRETTLFDPAARRALWEGGLAAVQASEDPLIQLVLATDQDAREIRREWAAQVSGPADRYGQMLAEARFAVLGDSVYPDATGTPRLSYGRIQGWSENGRDVPAMVTVADFWNRATGAFPYQAAPRLQSARDRLDPSTVFTVSTTHDIVGGNSGSPLIAADGSVIGLVFDGNLPSLGGAYRYEGEIDRAVAVSAQMVEAALVNVYGGEALARELRTGRGQR
ncbi:S46 family peptidase [Brevundimonas sp. 2R-24]|uniref:Dipeptidyl-peptidase n=1 Tax=Peiella sedimenti TaxID=3061083 RepID=A0ABT8SHX1_9CAUL|nr:S46 family peptidase [Caulobacteraceae bacterium XZ-24]